MTTIPSFYYPLVCFRAQAKRKLSELSLALLEDSCAEDREYAFLLTSFLSAVSGPYLPWPIARMRSYEHYLAQRGNFYFCPDEEVLETPDGLVYPPASERDLYLEPYRDVY